MRGQRGGGEIWEEKREEGQMLEYKTNTSISLLNIFLNLLIFLSTQTMLDVQFSK